MEKKKRKEWIARLPHGQRHLWLLIGLMVVFPDSLYLLHQSDQYERLPLV
ncbi:MAG: hypothetical protein ACLTSG_06010 [Lachnospiraceae bacterium]